MPDTTQTNRPRSWGRDSDKSDGVEMGPVRARQGFRGRPVLYVLGASLALAIVAYVIIHSYFAAS